MIYFIISLILMSYVLLFYMFKIYYTEKATEKPLVILLIIPFIIISILICGFLNNIEYRLIKSTIECYKLGSCYDEKEIIIKYEQEIKQIELNKVLEIKLKDKNESIR